MSARWFDVYSVCYGAQDRSEVARTDERAEVIVDEIRAVYKYENVSDWAIYVTPHYCDLDGPFGECKCVQYLTDHHPIASSEAVV